MADDQLRCLRVIDPAAAGHRVLRRGGRQALIGQQETQHQRQADDKHHKLQRRQQALHQSPAGGVAPGALLGGVQAGVHRGRSRRCACRGTVGCSGDPGSGPDRNLKRAAQSANQG